MNKILCEIDPKYPVKDILPYGQDILEKTTLMLCKREILDGMLYGNVYAVENNERIIFNDRTKVGSIIEEVISKRNKTMFKEGSVIEEVIAKENKVAIKEEPVVKEEVKTAPVTKDPIMYNEVSKNNNQKRKK